MDGLVRKLCVDLSFWCPQLESAFHGRHEGLAVVLQGVRVTNLIPELTLPGRIRLQVRRPPQEGDSVIDLVAAHGERGGSPRPDDGAGAQSLDLVVLAGPGDVEVLRAHSQGVVVCQQWS